VLSLLPSLVIPVLSPAVGQTYSFVDAIAHSLCLFVAGSVFYSLAILLSTVFGDVWRPLLLACAVGFALALANLVSRDFSAINIFRVMAAESYFRTGQLPWAGLLVSVLLSAAMLQAAAVNFARKDF